MGRPISARIFHRLATYALVAALAGGATIPSSVSEAEAFSPEERSGAATKSEPATQDHQGPIGLWLLSDNEPDAEQSFFQSWLARVYSKLVGLKAAISLAFSYAWQLGHSKPGNTCS